MYATLISDLDRGGWAEDNPNRCPCRGSGWLGSDFDTWHRCPIHGDGVPHPEAALYEDGAPDFDYGAHRLACLRRAWVVLRKASGMGPGAFRAACEARLPSGAPRTGTAWVDAADDVATAAVSEHDEADARARGFDCALEAQWADAAEQEATERRAWGLR